MATHDVPDRGAGWKNEKFEIDPAPVKKIAADWLELTTGNSPTAYASTYVDFDPSGGAVMERFVDVTTPMDTGVRDLMKDIVACVKATAEEITKSATFYETLDAEAAARIDKRYWEA